MAVNPNIKKKADDIRTKVYGKEVRESLASGLEEMSSDVVENEGRQSVVESRQDSVESQWQAVSDEMTDKDVISAPEIIAARNGESNLKARIDKDHQEVTAQLAETTDRTSSISNADDPLIIPSYDSLNSFQVTHPDYKFFKDGFLGYKHWMAHTPYPWTNDLHENPTVVVSEDGVTWEAPAGLENPIDKITQSENDNGEHFSDAILVPNTSNSTMEIWYRWSNKNTGLNRIYRKITSDGVTFTNRELVYETSNLAVSPTVILENGVYRMWLIQNSSGNNLTYMESTNGVEGSWSNETVVPVTYRPGENATVWHMHIFKENDNLYHLTFNERFKDIYWATSTDGKNFSSATKIMSKRDNENSWDSGELYRPSLGKVNGIYKLYYGALGSSPGRWYIGLSEGKTLKTLKGSDNYDRLANKNILKLITNYSELTESRINYLNVTNDKDEPPRFRLLNSGKYGVELELIDVDTVQISKDNTHNPGHLKVATLMLSDSGAVVKDGALRYNKEINKLQFLTKNSWDNLNNFTSTIPTQPVSSGTTGDYSVDENYLYVCYQAGRWIRIAKDETW